tara:strand:- start:2178 stop:2765 length:588 start_codon:yes stop_codon:yes gene_type:complete
MPIKLSSNQEELKALALTLAWPMRPAVRNALISDYIALQNHLDAIQSFLFTAPSCDADLAKEVLSARLTEANRQEFIDLLQDRPQNVSNYMIEAMHQHGLVSDAEVWKIMVRATVSTAPHLWSVFTDLNPALTPVDRHLVAAVCQCSSENSRRLETWLLNAAQNSKIDWSFVQSRMPQMPREFYDIMRKSGILVE